MSAAARALRVLIAGGGTGGHVFPALAVAAKLRQVSPESSVVFVGSRGGLEEKLVPAHGYDLRLLEVGKLRGAGALARARTLAGLPLAGVQALRLILEVAPDVVVGVGGYASGPMALAAWLRRIPLVLLEQNSIPGTTNRLLARLATRVVCAYRSAARRLPADRTLLLGNPVRPELLAALQAEREPRGGAGPTLLVLGGSQGAHALNDLVTGAAPALAQRFPKLHIVHQTGPSDRDRVAAAYQQAGVDAQVSAFVDDMAAVYRQADLVLSRAGATTLAELCVAGLPAVLVPYPFAADDHQAENAAELVEGHGALSFRQSELTVERLGSVLEELLADPSRLVAMSAAMRRAAFPDAGAAVVQLLQELSWSK
jgi:UDP-N-acetylglucosamine--N-acetylmuramyl-(pentapeptide) pyrophosphoryl-undecaprenol N-acetylglucosamine transferase